MVNVSAETKEKLFMRDHIPSVGRYGRCNLIKLSDHGGHAALYSSETRELIAGL